MPKRNPVSSFRTDYEQFQKFTFIPSTMRLHTPKAVLIIDFFVCLQSAVKQEGCVGYILRQFFLNSKFIAKIVMVLQANTFLTTFKIVEEIQF